MIDATVASGRASAGKQPPPDPGPDDDRERTGHEPQHLPARRQRDPGNPDEIPERREPPEKPGQNDRQPRHAD